MIAYKLESLKGKNRFSLVYENGRKVYEKNTLAFIASTPSACNADKGSDLPHIIRFAVVIGKKASKKAVVRNRVKRLMRESIKQSLDELQVTNNIEIIGSMIFIRKTAPKHPKLIGLKQVKPEIFSIFNSYFEHAARSAGDNPQ